MGAQAVLLKRSVPAKCTVVFARALVEEAMIPRNVDMSQCTTRTTDDSTPTGVNFDRSTKSNAKPLLVKELTYCYGGGATVHNRAFSEPKLIDINCAFDSGSRVLVAGANGAGKSTLLSIMGGKKMIPRDQCKIFGKAVFQDSSLNRDRMYCGDWWRT